MASTDDPIQLQPIGQHASENGAEQIPGAVITEQPTAAQPLQPTTAVTHEPPPQLPKGLDYLSKTDGVLIAQQVELREVMSGMEGNNYYEIKSKNGTTFLNVAENTPYCKRFWCGSQRGFSIRVFSDYHKTKVMHFQRPLRCDCICCISNCRQEVTVWAPADTVAGYVKERCSFWVPKYKICDANGKDQLFIDGPWCTWGCCRSVEFKVLAADGRTQIGKISKTWAGLSQEFSTDADNYGVSYPIDLDWKMKTCLVATAILIDFMFYEDDSCTQKNRTGPF